MLSTGTCTGGEKLVAKAKQQKLGDPFDMDTTQGPQVSQEQMDRILGYIDVGKKEGAECLIGGKRFGKKGYYVEPTVFTGVKDEMKIAKEEIFGPVMSVFSWKDEQEALTLANSTEYGLTASIFTNDLKTALRILLKLEVIETSTSIRAGRSARAHTTPESTEVSPD